MCWNLEPGEGWERAGPEQTPWQGGEGRPRPRGRCCPHLAPGQWGLQSLRMLGPRARDGGMVLKPLWGFPASRKGRDLWVTG